MRVDVIKLDEGPLVAPSAALADESTPAAVTRPDHAPHVSRDVPAAASRATTGPWPLRRREFLSGQIFEQHRQRSIDDLRQVPGRDGVSEQILGEA